MESTAAPTQSPRREAPVRPLPGPLDRAQEITLTAFQALGLSAPQAEQAAAEGGVVLNGTLVSVMPLPVSSLTGQGSDDLFMITVETRRRVADLSAPQTAAMLAHGPGLLAVHRATLGCHPDGQIVLHRTLDAAATTPQKLANAMFTAQQLVQLLWGDTSDPQPQ